MTRPDKILSAAEFEAESLAIGYPPGLTQVAAILGRAGGLRKSERKREAGLRNLALANAAKAKKQKNLSVAVPSRP